MGPPLRAACAKPNAALRSGWNADEHCWHSIHTPDKVPDKVYTAYPAHLHMNVLPHAQGRGLGRGLLQAWIDKAVTFGASQAHIGAHPDNDKGLGFWRKMGFRDIVIPGSDTAWLGRPLP